MAHLTYISDDKLYEIVVKVIKNNKEHREALSSNLEKFHKHVIDPFQAIFNSTISDWNNEKWVKFEILRQIEKNLGRPPKKELKLD